MVAAPADCTWKSNRYWLGLMNGISNGFSSLAPFLFGVFISAVGSYNGGLFLLVGMGVVGMICVGILTAQKY